MCEITSRVSCVVPIPVIVDDIEHAKKELGREPEQRERALRGSGHGESVG